MMPVEKPINEFSLDVKGIHKHFDGVYALAGVDLRVRSGEIHALLGENGAGKSTLIKVLTGVYQPDEGSVTFRGADIRPNSVNAAQQLGIVALYQELSIIPGLSVAENIFIGDNTPRVAGFVKWKELRERATSLLRRLNQNIPLNKLAGALSPVQQTMVSVARALALNANLLILDEPTASLTDREIGDLFLVLRKLRAEGVAIVYVSHRLEEVFELCDSMTVMRGGRTIVSKPISETSTKEIITAMVGREPGELFPDRDGELGDVALEVDQLVGNRILNVSFNVAAGEVVGIAGLAGSGRSELLRLLAGAQKPKSGKISVHGREVAPTTGVVGALAEGIALVPEERRTQGVILDSSIQENIALANLGQVTHSGWVNTGSIATLADHSISRLQIKAQSRKQNVRQLSGGNQQKVVLAKILARSPKVLLLDEPTRGIDVGTKSEIYRLIRELAKSGTAIVMVSSELPELLGVTDRILVMHEGSISGEAQSAKSDEETLLTYSYGRGA